MLVDSPAESGSEFAPHFLSAIRPWGPEAPELEQAYRLRFEVYCLDCGFLDATHYTEPRETDQYDDGSTHAFAYNLGGDLVGYVRLIHHDAGRPFPWQLHCPELLPGVALPPGGESAEVSRLMVRRDYRRRKSDLIAGVDTAQSLDEDDGGERRRRSPQIMLSLYRRMYQHSRPAGIRYWYAAMERPLARALQAMGFSFRQIGPETDYFGPVAPYLADLRELEAVLQARCPELLAWMQAPAR